MAASGVAQSDVTSWIEQSVKNEDFVACEINLRGKPEKGEGFAGDILFARVTGTTTKNEKKVLDLVVKHGKSNAHLRKIIPMRSLFETEIVFYDKLVPAIKKLQTEKNIRDGFEAVSTCYSTLLLDEMEVIVLDDLRARGYQIRDRMQTMNLDHLKLILKEYGKFHAASFALRSQKNEEYKSITELLHDNTLKYVSNENMASHFEEGIFEALDIVRDGSDQRLRRKIDLFKKVIGKGCVNLMLDLLNADEPQTVITHGDGWNNNFMFKYKDENQLSPSEVRIIDFQFSALRSPVFDIVHVIYANSSKKELDRFDELLETYYTAFSNYLREAGCNPDELFPFTDLMKHWEKYSIYGALMIPMILTFGLCDKSDAPDYNNFKEGQEPASLIHIKIADENQFQERLRAVYDHYLDSCY